MVPTTLADPRSTVRRRLAGLTLLLAAVVVWTGFGGAAGAPADASAPAPERVVVVSPGETVWDLALAHAPDGLDPRAYMLEVIERNGVEPTALRPGTVLRLPDR